MTALTAFQHDLARALLAPDTLGDLPPAIARLTLQPGFAVHRNTVLKGCVDALEANFPAVARLVGSEWLRAAGAVYARNELPAEPMLLDYGARFPDFLAGFEPAADLPYLPAVARLDRLWIEAHTAADAPVLQADALAGLAPQALQWCSLVPHPAARWAWFDAVPAYTIWSRNRSGIAGDGGERDEGAAGDAGAASGDCEHLPAPIAWQPEGALLTRPGLAVLHDAPGRGAVAFLDSCSAGRSVEAAALAALDADPQADLAGVVSALVAAGAFTALRPPLRSDMHLPPNEDTIA